MTESEAIKLLKDASRKREMVAVLPKSDFGKCVIQALEKQIPKKPILKNGESRSFVDYENGYGEYKVTKWQDWVCPICG